MHDPLVAVRNDDGTVNWLKVGEAEQARRTGCIGDLPPEASDVLDWLHANGASFHVANAAERYDQHLRELVRTHGGTIVTERQRIGRDGRVVVKREVRRFKPTIKAPSVVQPRARVAAVIRPRERRASSSSRTAGTDPGADDGGSDPPPRRLKRRRGGLRHISFAIWAFLAEVGR